MPKRFSLYASGYLLGMEDIGVVDVRRRVGDAVEVPVEDPGVEQRIAEVGDGGVEADGDRPGEDDGEEQEKGEEAPPPGARECRADARRPRDNRMARMSSGRESRGGVAPPARRLDHRRLAGGFAHRHRAGGGTAGEPPALRLISSPHDQQSRRIGGRGACAMSRMGRRSSSAASGCAAFPRI